MLRLSASDALCTRLEALVTPSNGVFFALVLAVGESTVVFRALNPRDRVTPCDSGSVDNCVYVEKLWTEVKAGGCPQSASRRAAALEPHPDTEFEGGAAVFAHGTLRAADLNQQGFSEGRSYSPSRLKGRHLERYPEQATSLTGESRSGLDTLSIPKVSLTVAPPWMFPMNVAARGPQNSGGMADQSVRPWSPRRFFGSSRGGARETSDRRYFALGPLNHPYWGPLDPTAPHA